MKQLREYNHIVWDWNGTLLNDAELCHDIVVSILLQHQANPLDFESFTKAMAFPIQHFYKAVGLPHEGDNFQNICTAFHDDYHVRMGECDLHPASRRVLEAFAERGYTQSILSAHPIDLLSESVKRFSVGNYFTDLVAPSDQLSTSKIEMGQEWLVRSKLLPTKIIMFGDTVHDWEVATAMGIDVALIAAGAQHRSLLEACEVPVFDSIDELLAEMSC